MPPARDQAVYEQNLTALKPFHRRSPGLCRTALWGVVVPALCTLVFWPLRHAVGPSSILLTYLLGVFLVATRHGRGASITASFVSAAAFAFFFAPPIYSLAMTDVENVIGLGVMLAVAHVTSRMLERTRTQAEIAARREAHATMLYRLSHALAEATDEEQITEIAEQHILGDFGATSALLVSDREGRLFHPKDPGCANVPQGFDPYAAQRMLGQGRSHEPKGVIEAKKDSLTYLPLQGCRGCVGVLAMQPLSSTQRLDPEFGTFLETFLSQIAQALDRVRLAAEAREASVHAEAESLRNALLTAISHDLRTPLTRIVGTASALVDRDEALAPEERREFTHAIQDEAQRMSDLMSKILDMAQLATGKLALHREWNAIEEIVGATLTRLDKALQDRPVDIGLGDSLPLVWVDAVLLQQVLMNLIDNAIKYTPSGSPIEIAAECSSSTLRLSVADRGPGFPEGTEERLFEKFYRIEQESSQSGVGLGLALCRAIMEAHGGTLGAANRPAGGAIFTLTLPLHESPPLAWEESLEAEQ